jgi:integrase/recombinase XerD
MTLKQAKVLADSDVDRLLSAVTLDRYTARNRVIILLSVKAGLRAGEIAQLTWPMVLDANGRIAPILELRNHAAKNGQGRVIPIHPLLKHALESWQAQIRASNPSQAHWEGCVIASERKAGPSAGMRPSSIVNWFAELYASCGLQGCSSHSGRRTFVTKAAKAVHQAGGSLRDVQQLAGHRSINMTQRYIEGDTQAQHRLVNLI